MEQLNKLLQQQFDKMCQTGKLFRSELSADEIWNTYITSFENDPVFRDPASSVHNCNYCKNSIRRYAGIVAVDESNRLMTIFDVETDDEEYQNTVKKLSETIKASAIRDVFYETFDSLKSLPYESCNEAQESYKLGMEKNIKQYTKAEAEMYGVVSENEIRTFHHFHLNLPKQYVDFTGKSIESIMANYRDDKNVFQRAMEEISLDTLLLVRDLILQGSLLDGQAHLHKLNAIIPLKQEYDQLATTEKDNWCWVNSYKFQFAKFKNELIGVLCSELAEGMELNTACQNWNKRVDPINYMKTTAPITKKQIEEAQKFVVDNGYVESFDRRVATIEDIKVSEIKHINSADSKPTGIALFDGVKPTFSRHKRAEFDKVETVTIEKFMEQILPTCTGVEVFLQNNHENNMVTMTTANNPDSKRIFKWNNNYSWTYNGNLAGKSQIKEAVKQAGGKVDGVLRFSISWNENGRSICDLDAHAIEPNQTHIYYGSYKGTKTSMSGFLDVDMICPRNMGVENITWVDKRKMQDGQYKFYVKNYDRGFNTGFKAEIEYEGEVYNYEYNGNAQGDTNVAIVTLKNGQFSIQHQLPETQSTREIYGLETNMFHKVNLICLSPNHWDDNEVGNKHYFFMLEGCKNPNPIRSFHNENLNSDLVDHRKVLEVLANTTMIQAVNSDKKLTGSQELRSLQATDKQLSGLGYNATVKDELIVKLKGSHSRILKITF